VIARFPNRRAETYLLWSLGDLQGDRGAFEEALSFYQKALELLGSSEPSLRCSLLISFSMVRRWQGRLPEAITLATEASTLAGKLGLAGEGCMAQAAIWSARALSGQAAEALKHLDAAASDLRKHGLQFELMQALGLCTHAALLCADAPAAQAYWRSVLDLTQEIGSVHSLVSEIIRTPLLESLAAADSTTSEPLRAGLERLREAQLKAPHETHVQPAGAHIGAGEHASGWKARSIL
jgi:tetratricopeptide (TPR) repeat protein